MVVDDVLTLQTEGLASLRAPVMVIALHGLFDMASAATTAVAGLVSDDAITVAEIDPDPFFDFTQERPMVEIDEGEFRVIRWPDSRFDVVRGAGPHDLVLGVGTEPHLHWATYAQCVIAVSRRLGCEAVLTVGSSAEAVPHTRMPTVTGSTSNPDLASRLGLAAPTYQGVTGLVGVLHAELERVGVPSISLRVGIPHYLINAEHPTAVAVLQTHISHVVGITVGTDHRDDIGRWRKLHDEVVEGDPQLGLYVRMLEQEYDRRAEEAIPSADDLGAEFERFLRTQHHDEGENPDRNIDEPDEPDEPDGPNT
jgi:PAC2 family protein